MRDWLKFDKNEIFNGKDEKGNRYLSQFLSDYQQTFNPEDINAGCQKCLNGYYQKMINHLTMSNKKKEDSNNSGYLLKKKYENIPLSFGSRHLVNNQNITDEMAKALIDNHAKGEDLFQVIPESANEEVDPVKELKSLSRKDLNEKAGDLGIENPEDFQNKAELSQAIIDLNEKDGEEEADKEKSLPQNQDNDEV